MTQAVYDAIMAYWRAFSCPPTVRWLSESLNISFSTVFYHLGKLSRMGILVKVGHRWVPIDIQRHLASLPGAHTQIKRSNV